LKAALKSKCGSLEQEQIIEAVPTTADQVHARQILVFDAPRRIRSSKNWYLAQILQPLLFSTIHKRVAIWDGSAGYLTQPEVEAAAFSLEAGNIAR